MNQEEVLNFSGVNEEAILDFSQVASGPRPELSSEQREARDSPGNTLVVACPGAGKTEILIQRHERNVSEGKRCLSLTFTIAAANEIKKRIPGAEAFTIHGYCYSQTGWNGDYPKLLCDYILKEHVEEFDEVLLDELQNVSPLMLDAIRRIPKESLFAVGDPQQSCYIGKWAANLWDKPALGPKAFERVKVRYDCVRKDIKGNRRANQHVVDLLERLEPRGVYPLGPKHFEASLIVARTHRELGWISDELLGEDIPHTIYNKRDARDTKYESFGSSPMVDLMVFHQCVGTEYKRVFLFDWDGYTAEDYNLLYTAVARAAEEVYTVDGGFGQCQRLPKNINIPFKEMTALLR